MMILSLLIIVPHVHLSKQIHLLVLWRKKKSVLKSFEYFSESKFIQVFFHVD